MENVNVGSRHQPLYVGLKSVQSIVKVCTPEWAKQLKEEIEATPHNCRHAPKKNSGPTRGQQLSFGKSTEPTNKPATKCDNVRIVTPASKYKQMPPGGSTPRFKTSTISMPYPASSAGALRATAHCGQSRRSNHQLTRGKGSQDPVNTHLHIHGISEASQLDLCRTEI